MNHLKNFQIEDLTVNQRLGFKGEQAEIWLNQQAISTPLLPNHWLETHQENGQDLLVLRLGSNEFLIEALNDLTNFKPAEMDKISAAGVYGVPRADMSFRLTGKKIDTLLAQICMLDFTQELQKNALLMTQIAGVSSILLKESAPQNSYRFWCDASYKDYMLTTLNRLAEKLEEAT